MASIIVSIARTTILFSVSFHCRRSLDEMTLKAAPRLLEPIDDASESMGKTLFKREKLSPRAIEQRMPINLNLPRNLANYLFALLFLVYLYLRRRQTRSNAASSQLVARQTRKERTVCFPNAPSARTLPSFSGPVVQVPGTFASLTEAFLNTAAGSTIVLDGS